MELTVTQENFSRALSTVGRVASSRTQLPILNNILLRTDGNRLLIAATDLELAATQYIGAKITKPGALTVPARLITEFVSSLPRESIDIKVVNNSIHLSSGNYKSVINGVDADDFPELPTIDEKGSVNYSINAEEFKQAVSQTIITASNDSSRPILTGVYWHSHEGFIYLAGTDGYRLSERKLVETKSEVAAIIPTQTLQEALRTLTDDVDVVEILFDESQVRFRINEAEVISRLIDGNFPDYRQLVPQSSDNTAVIDRQELVRVTKIASLFSRDAGGSITLTINNDNSTVLMHSITSELGENTSEVAASEVAGDGSITLNSRYLADALNVIDAKQVVIGFNGKLSPFLLKSSDPKTNYYHIVMPLKS